MPSGHAGLRGTIKRVVGHRRRRLRLLCLERERRRIARLRELRKRRLATGALYKPRASYAPGYEPVVALFAPMGRQARLRGHPLEATITCPPRFSFIDTPDESIQCVADFCAAIVSGARVIRLVQTDCTDIDLCAASVLNAAGISARKEYGVRFRGAYPNAAPAREIVMATGLPRCLGLPVPEPEAFMTHPLRCCRRGRETAGSASVKERETQDLADYVNACLGRYSCTLSAPGKDYVAKLVGEVITNAEEHSGRQDWWIGAYLRQPAGQAYGDCHLTIFNFGRSLAESLQQLPNGSRLRQEINALVKLHRRSTYFYPSRWTEENLWTLYALQEGVSWRNDQTDLLGHHGLGTIKMIETFQHLGQTSRTGVQPLMCIASGRTHILFDSRFRLQSQDSERGEQRRVIAFNKANDLRLPPDPGSVRRLRRPFPGTLISLRFYLDPVYLIQVARGGSGGGQD